MAEITAGRPVPARPDGPQLTDDQIHGRACRRCSTTEPPLHPDETLLTRPFTDVIRETVSVLCTPCLVASR